MVPEVNADAVMGYAAKNIIANPNCSTAQLVVALKPLHDRARIKRVVVATYQSVSGAGKEGMDELWDQTKSIYNPVSSVPPSKFQRQIAFNVIPQIDVFLDSGETKEEWKMVAETKKIMDPSIRVTATCVRVPVVVGHAEAVWIETETPLSGSDAENVLAAAPGLKVEKVPSHGHAIGSDEVHIGRVRDDPATDNGLVLYLICDNLRKGAALNAIQIAERLVAAPTYSGSSG